MRLARDTWLIFQRAIRITLGNPAWIIVGLAQPVLYLLLFAPLLKSVALMPGFPRGGAYNVFVPGILVQQAVFGTAGVGFALIGEVREGVIERFRVTPVSRVALLFGRALRDVLVLLVQCFLLVVLSIPFGLTIQPLGLAIALALVGLIGLMIASVAYSLALALRSEDSYAPVIFTATLPLLLLSGVLLPLSLAPAWLRAIAALNPFSYAVEAARAVFAAHLSDPSVLRGVAIMAVLAVIAVVVAGRSFSRAAA